MAEFSIAIFATSGLRCEKTPANQMNTLTLNGGLTRREVLKKEFLQCIGVRSMSETTLQRDVMELIDAPASRKTLVVWSVQLGYTRVYVSSMFNRILCVLGLRERRAGAGRKLSTRTLEFLRYAKTRSSGQCLNVLQGALRAGKAENAEASGNRFAHTGHATELIAPSQLQNCGTNCEGIIERNGNAVLQSTLTLRPSEGSTF